jgi:hypothetical protein
MKSNFERCPLTYEEIEWIRRQLYLRDIPLSEVAAKAGRSASDKTFYLDWYTHIGKKEQNVLRKTLGFPTFEKLRLAAGDKGGGTWKV